MAADADMYASQLTIRRVMACRLDWAMKTLELWHEHKDWYEVYFFDEACFGYGNDGPGVSLGIIVRALLSSKRFLAIKAM